MNAGSINLAAPGRPEVQQSSPFVRKIFGRMPLAGSPAKCRRFADGFTLIELMVVILIIGLLATIVVQNLRSATDKAKRVKAQADIAQLKSALDRYYLDAGSYPTSDQGLPALVASPDSGNVPHDWGGPYIEKIPPDPWGHPYAYQSDGNSYLLKSFGADGVEGGDGKNADIDGSSS